MAISDRLRFARQALNLTLEEVAQKATIGASTLSEFENGKREPRLLQLKLLADLYRRSTNFFLSDDPLPVEIVLWRQKPTSPSAEVLQAQLLRLAEQYHNLEQWCDACEELNLPFSTDNPQQFGYKDAEKLAHGFRNTFGLGERPGQSILRVLEEVCKIKIFHLPFEPTGSAACSYHERFGAAILLNSNNVLWRRNFDLAHELFHLLTWKVFRQVGDQPISLASDAEEKFATCFARNLLMPQEPLRIAINSQMGSRSKLNFDDLFEVARQFDVSVEALLWQMTFIYNLSKKDVEAEIGKVRSQMAFWDKRQKDTPPTRPIRFEALASEALHKGLISTGRYSEYLGITRRDAMRQVEEEVPANAEIEIAHP